MAAGFDFPQRRAGYFSRLSRADHGGHFPANDNALIAANDNHFGIVLSDALSHATSYVYDAFGNLKTVTDPSSNVTTNTYDVRGRKISSADPDMGTWTYVYDVLDELTSQTDAKSQNVTLVYDKLGRITSRTETSLTSTWTYDTATKGIGQLASATGTQSTYSRAHSYDSLGRPSTVLQSIDGTAYTYTTTYNTDGRVDTVTYPSGLVLKYVYVATYGYLSQVKNNATGTVYWTANTRDAELHALTQTAGNGVVTTQAFDPNTGLVQTIAAGSGTVANFAYGFDVMGNLTSRSDTSTGQSVYEKFCYDQLNRLTDASLASTNPAACTSTTHKATAYDSLGDLTSKTGIGTYTYGAGAAGPHAVTSIVGTVNGVVNPTYTYDANGNMTAGAGRTVTTMSFNMADTITQGASSFAFTYSPEHARIRQIAPGVTTTYLNAMGAMSEKAVAGAITTWHDYIQADGKMVAERFCTGAAPCSTGQTWSYFVLDHLGSVSVITDGTGAVIANGRLSYDAWGMRRHSDGTPAACGTITSATTRGFTGHEEIDGACLVNANARIYDPAIGRFMAADPSTEAPYNLQDLNRYSYVLNNPLSLTDPSGLCFLGCFWHAPIARAIAAIVVVGILQQYEVLPAIGSALGLTASASVAAVVNGGILGGIGGLISTGTLKGAALGALQGGLFAEAGNLLQSAGAGGFIGIGHGASVFIAHGFVGGIVSAAGGGNIGAGFLAGGISSLAPEPVQGEPFEVTAEHTVEAAILGGTGSMLGGGKFASGAETGAFAYLFNEVNHSLDYTSPMCTKAGICQKIYSTPAEDREAFLGLTGIVTGGLFGGVVSDLFGLRGVYDFLTGTRWVTVGRWMSPDEIDAMSQSGRMVESESNGVSSVSYPANPAAYKNPPPGDVYVEFDIPETSLGASGNGWGKVYGPNSLQGQHYGVTEMPPARNIRVPGE